jgi:Double-GTPase 1
MSEINLNLGNASQPKNLGNNQPTPMNSDFLADINLHEIARVFTNFKRENRILIVPIGFPQAGKSLLLSSLMYYARKGNDTMFRTNVERSFPYDKGNLAVNDMVDFFDKGNLYDATQKGTLDLIGINISPSKAKLPELKLAFLDLAGEDIKSIKTSEQGEFTDKITAVFNGLKVDNSPVIFTLITPYEPARYSGESSQNAHDREDALHYDFLNYIKQNQPQLLKNAKFFVIVSQWDKNPNEKDSIESYIKTYRPSIYNYVKSSNVIWGNYSVGKLLETPIDGVVKQEIVRINYDYPSRFWKKLYHICTNKTLDNKSFFQKLFG